MTCPKCANEMKQGHLQSSREIAWSPEKRGFVRRFDAETVDFVNSLSTGTNLAAHHCPTCKLILAEYTNDEIR